MTPDGDARPAAEEPDHTGPDVDPDEIDPADAALLADLAGLLQPQVVPPPEALDAARGVFTWLTVDAELASLTFDSLVDLDASRTRATVTARTLTFESTVVVIELEVEEGAVGRRLLGQLVPPQVAELELRRAGEVVRATSDAMGRFTLPLGDDPERIELRCRVAAGTVTTSGPTVV